MTVVEKREKLIKDMIESIENDYSTGRHLEKGYNAMTETGRIHSNFYMKEEVYLQHHVSKLNNVLKLNFISKGKVVDGFELDLSKLESAYIVKNRDERLGEILDSE